MEDTRTDMDLFALFEMAESDENYGEALRLAEDAIDFDYDYARSER